MDFSWILVGCADFSWILEEPEETFTTTAFEKSCAVLSCPCQVELLNNWSWKLTPKLREARVAARDSATEAVEARRAAVLSAREAAAEAAAARDADAAELERDGQKRPKKKAAANRAKVN